jgi:hypothetical protein
MACSDSTTAPSAPDPEPAATLFPSAECQVWAIGTLAPPEGSTRRDRFAGSAIGGPDGALGVWTHRTPDGQRFVGVAERLACEPNGTLLVIIQGVGSFGAERHAPFQIAMQDREDPNFEDTYLITIVDPEHETVLYHAAGSFSSGDMWTRRFQ